MPSPLPLDESVADGDRQHALRHSDLAAWVNRIADHLGMDGQSDEQAWLFVIPSGHDGYGLVIDCNATSLWAAFMVRDHTGAPIFTVLPAGGAGVASADVADGVWVSEDTLGRSGFLNTGGGLRLVYGDPAGGAETLAIGDADADGQPSANPDGSHTAEHGFVTRAGVVLWSPPGSGGRLRYRTRAGHEDELLAPLLRRQMAVTAPGNGTSLVTTGTAAPTVASTNITAASADGASGPAVSYTTTAAPGVDAGVISAFGVVQPRWAPLFHTRIVTDASAVTSTRLAAGLVTADIAGNAGPASSGSFSTAAGAWLRYDSSVDGTAVWRAVTADGSNATVTTTTAAVAAGTVYELTIEGDAAGAAWRFWVNGTLVATHTTTLPAASAALGYLVRLRTLAAAARALRLGHIRLTSR